MLGQLHTVWFQLFGWKWLKVSALIQGGSPPFLDLLLHFGAFPDNRHAISARHLGLFLARQRGVSRAGWRLEAKDYQKQFAYRLIDETVPHTGRALVRTKLDRIAHAFTPVTQGQHAPPAPLEFDTSETPREAMKKALNAAVYDVLAAMQAGDIPEMQRAADRLKATEEAADAVADSIKTGRYAGEYLRG